MEMNKCFYCGCELTEENISPVVLTSNPPKFICKNCQSGTPSDNSGNKNIELFDSEYVHFMWSDELEGKEGFFADNIDKLKSNVRSGNCTYTVSKSDFESSPFTAATSNWRFFYYDPNYECKRAYSEGKQIQTKYKTGDEWKDVSNPGWYEYKDYRIKPGPRRRMTYRQLAEWLAKGNGQYRTSLISTMTYTFLTYVFPSDTIEVPEDYLLRRWDSDEWIEPTYEVYDSDVSHKVLICSSIDTKF